MQILSVTSIWRIRGFVLSLAVSCFVLTWCAEKASAEAIVSHPSDLPEVPHDAINKTRVLGATAATRFSLSHPALEEIAKRWAANQSPNFKLKYANFAVTYSKEMEKYRMDVASGTMTCEKHEQYRKKIGLIIDQMENFGHTWFGYDDHIGKKAGQVRVKSHMQNVYQDERNKELHKTVETTYFMLAREGKFPDGRTLEEFKTPYLNQFEKERALPCVEDIAAQQDDIDDLLDGFAVTEQKSRSYDANYEQAEQRGAQKAVRMRSNMNQLNELVNVYRDSGSGSRSDNPVSASKSGACQSSPALVAKAERIASQYASGGKGTAESAQRMSSAFQKLSDEIAGCDPVTASEFDRMAKGYQRTADSMKGSRSGY